MRGQYRADALPVATVSILGQPPATPTGGIINIMFSGSEVNRLVCVCVCLPPSPMATLPDIQWRCRTLTMHDLDEDLHTRETGAEEKKRFCWFSWMPLFFGFPWQRPSLEADSRCCSCLRCSIDRGVPRGTLLEIREPCLVQCPSPESGPAKVFRGRSANSPAI